MLFSTIFLGAHTRDKNTFDDIREDFITWGIAHYLARSGLHLIVIIVMLMFFLKKIPLNFSVKQIIILFFVICYSLFSWTSISYLRAFLMLILHMICRACSVEYQPFHIMMITTLCVVLDNPFQLFFLDFQLSFLLTGALAWHSFLQEYKKKKIYHNIAF